MAKTLHYDCVANSIIEGPAPTCVRAGSAWRRNSSGAWESVAANTIRHHHDAAGSPLGWVVEESRTNLFLNSAAPVTQSITTTAQDYTIWVEGTGSVTVSGTATGVATEGSPLTVTATAGTMTCTVAGSLSHAQVEAGGFATTYIETAGAVVTRNADKISASFSAAAAGSLYVSAGECNNNISGRTLVTIHDGGLSNRITLDVIGFSARGLIRTAGSFVFLENPIVLPNDYVFPGTGHSVLAYQVNDAILYDGGEPSLQDTTVAVPTVTTLSVGYRSDSSFYFNGNIKAVRFYDERLDNATLENMSNGKFPGAGGTPPGMGLGFGKMGKLGAR